MSMCDKEDDGFTGFLEQIVNLEGLDGAALGITKLVIEKGEKALTEKQRYVFKKHVLDEYTVEACARCGSNVPWSEMYDAATEHGLCNYCWHMTSKDD
ncbi:hypothetical protein [Uliginosibacterium sediminicola]|uniref:Uncharacterized protein n=1 Tax=Uliginosibacterium sediminicola TaxID=2024550 RepID=A0ABU9Z3D4_9RHOO